MAASAPLVRRVDSRASKSAAVTMRLRRSAGGGWARRICYAPPEPLATSLAITRPLLRLLYLGAQLSDLLFKLVPFAALLFYLIRGLIGAAFLVIGAAFLVIG